MQLHWSCQIHDNDIAWPPDSAVGYGRELLKARIMTDRIMRMQERYPNRDYNKKDLSTVMG